MVTPIVMGPKNLRPNKITRYKDVSILMRSKRKKKPSKFASFPGEVFSRVSRRLAKQGMGFEKRNEGMFWEAS